MLFPLNCLKDHWIPWINLIKERHEESRNGGKRERKGEKWRKRREEERKRKERERKRKSSLPVATYTNSL